MTTIDEIASKPAVITAGTIPLNPNVGDYADAKGKIVLFVQDEDEGRSIYMGIETYGEMPCVYEVRYDDWADIVSRMAADVVMNDADDPFAKLLNQGGQG